MRSPSPLLIALLLLGCASTPRVPRDYDLAPAERMYSGHGSWVFVSQRDGETLQGELLAVDGERIVILPLSPARAREIPVKDVRAVKVSRHSGGAGDAIGWAFAGTVSTVSHGFFLLLSAPVWIVTGAVSSHSAVNEVVLDCPPTDPQLRNWARFPQGLPAGFDAGSDSGSDSSN